MSEKENNIIVPIDEIIPNELFIIPIKENPIFPGFIIPISTYSPNLVNAIESFGDHLNFLGIISIKPDLNNLTLINSSNIYHCGTLVKVIKKIKLPNNGLNLLVNSLKRFKIASIIKDDPGIIIANVEYYKESLENKNSLHVKAFTRAILNNLRILSKENPFLMEQIKLTLANNMDDPEKIGDFSISILKLSKEDYQDILQNFSLEERLEKVLKHLEKEVQISKIQRDIENETNKEVEKKQRMFFLKEQLKAIKKELDVNQDQEKYYEFKNKIDAIQSINEKDRKYLNKELERFKNLESYSPEYNSLYNYLETICSLPWDKKSKDNFSIKKVEKILDRNHYGLNDIKLRILEFLSVKKLRKEKDISEVNDGVSSIICLFGAPGVGKTSLAKSIAEAMDRNFYRISLGGIRDEAEIKGHRKTYIGAMPGKLIQGLINCETLNPVFLLDELDKIVQNYQSDPSSSLLEVLDPEQNKKFTDHYLNIPFDLSNILFICTANSLENIPRPLYDRMEIINLSGYLKKEKLAIAKNYIFPKQLKLHALDKTDLLITQKSYLDIIENYTQENGVRDLSRLIEKICRKRASEIVQKKDFQIKITKKKLKKYLGYPKYKENLHIENDQYGIAKGLAWTEYGGKVLTIESIIFQGKQDLKLTGQLGNIMVESANIAYHFVRHLLAKYFSEEFFEKNTIHLHIPAGAIPKDGPSAGITMATSLLSLLLKKLVPKNISMTGELSLTGHVLPIGGLKEKLIAAKSYHLNHIFIPKKNLSELSEIPEDIKSGLKVELIDHYNEIYKILFESTLAR